MNGMEHETIENIRIREQTAEDISPWQRLANAIVEQAVKDYRTAQARVKANPQNSDHAKEDVRKLERFFCSQWFETLTEADGQLLLSRLKKEDAQ